MPMPFAPRIILTQNARSDLHALIRAHSTPQSLAQRARIVLRAADVDQPSNLQISRELSCDRHTAATCYGGAGMDRRGFLRAGAMAGGARGGATRVWDVPDMVKPPGAGAWIEERSAAALSRAIRAAQDHCATDSGPRHLRG